MKPPAPDDPGSISRPEFDQFLRDFVHEIRNHLNLIGLDAADLAEQAGPGLDGAKLQGHVRNCSAYLKEVRAAVSPEDATQPRPPLVETLQQIKNRKR